MKKVKKNDKWKELSDEFWDESQIIYHGQYQNGKKIGRWDVLYGEFEQIYINKKLNIMNEGGSYDELGNCKKRGHWIEIND